MKSIRGSFRAAGLIVAAASVLVFAAGATAQNNGNGNGNGNSNSNDNPWPYATTGKSPVLAVVGDISCQPGGEIATNGTVLEPQGEAKSEFCFNPKAPYTSTALWISQEGTANQIEAMKPDAVAITGDLQYQVGQFQDFEQSYDLTYGAFKKITRPSPGNHEFYDEHSETGVAGYGYFSYFNGFQINTANTPTTTSTTVSGAPAMPIMTTVPDPCPPALAAACNYPGLTAPIAQPVPRADGQAGHFELGAKGGLNGTGVGDGWYSYNLGAWHLISLNVECSTQPDGCSKSGSWFGAELAWLKNDLASNNSACTLAYWHQPTFSATNSIAPEGVAAQDFWKLLYEYGADLVLNGHDHLYARYRPLDPNGNSDPKKGIREFIVGTGGETLDPVVAAGAAGETAEDPGMHTNFNKLNLENATGDYWGVMSLTLDHNGYEWDFESVPGLEGPVNNGQFPSVAPTGSYSDKGVGTCHGPVNGGGN